MRTRRVTCWGHGSAARANWVRNAEARAPLGSKKAAQKASPTVLNTSPPADSMAERRIWSCLANAFDIAVGAVSHNWVDPTTSVNRNVTSSAGTGTDPYSLTLTQV